VLRYLGLAHVESLHFSSILELSAFVSNFFLFFFDTRRDDQPTSTTFWIYRLEKQLSLALSSGIFISMVLFFWAPSKFCLLSETWNADVRTSFIHYTPTNLLPFSPSSHAYCEDML
jgi:hypothetical protein